MKINVLFYILMIAAIVSCSKRTVSTATNPDENSKEMELDYTGPPTIVYKTKGDYFNNVPVTMSKDGKSISSYPDIRDVFYKGELAYPTQLGNGYLLDNRGIDQYVAFLVMTYEEYSQLDKTPEAGELTGMILDMDPLLEIYNCGNRYLYKDGIEDLKKLAESGSVKHCRKLIR